MINAHHLSEAIVIVDKYWTLIKAQNKTKRTFVIHYCLCKCVVGRLWICCCCDFKLLQIDIWHWNMAATTPPHIANMLLNANDGITESKKHLHYFRLMTHASSFLALICSLESLAFTEIIHSISIQLIMFGLICILCNVYVNVIIIEETFSIHFVHAVCCPLFHVHGAHITITTIHFPQRMNPIVSG